MEIPTDTGKIKDDIVILHVALCDVLNVQNPDQPFIIVLPERPDLTPQKAFLYEQNDMKVA